MKNELTSSFLRAHGFYTTGHIVLAPHNWHSPPPDSGDINDVRLDFILAIDYFIRLYQLHSDIPRNG